MVDRGSQIRELKRESRLSTQLDRKIDLQRKATRLERDRAEKRSALFAAEDEIDRDKEALLAKAGTRLQFREGMSCLFRIVWQLEPLPPS